MNKQKENQEKPKTIKKKVHEKIGVGESGIIRVTFKEKLKNPKNIRRSILMLILCTLIGLLFGEIMGIIIGVLVGFIISLIWIFFGGPTEIEREKETERRF
ncbi:hypothetical protein ES703_52365 [subsurface metagenome]